MQIVIPNKTFIKIILRGIFDFSFIDEIKNSNLDVGERSGLEMANGQLIFFEKTDCNKIVVISAYHKSKKDEPIKKRVNAMMMYLVSILKI